MGWVGGTLLFAFGSAMIPILNIEAYLAALAAKNVGALWVLAVAAAVGQMAGKVVFYYIGRSSMGWSWVRRKTEAPKFQATLERWRNRVDERPLYAALVLFVSAAAGLPPFAILAVIAGSLRVPLPLFITVGLVGRFLRFLFILGAVTWLFSG